MEEEGLLQDEEEEVCCSNIEYADGIIKAMGSMRQEGAVEQPRRRKRDLREQYIAAMTQANPKMLLADSPIFQGLVTQRQLPFSVFPPRDDSSPDSHYHARIQLPLPDGKEACGSGVGRTRKEAERFAAIDACKKLDKLGFLVGKYTSKSCTTATGGWGENPKNILVTSAAFRSSCCGGSGKALPMTLRSSGTDHSRVFVAELVVPMPGQQEVFLAVGKGSSKAEAERACAYAACEKLHQEGLLKKPGDSNDALIHSFNKALHIQQQNERPSIVGLREEQFAMIEDALKRLHLEVECISPEDNILFKEAQDFTAQVGMHKAPNHLGKEEMALENARLCLETRKRFSSPDFSEQQHVRRALPSWHERQKIIDTIANNQVVVLTGETGCGKTTQVPQFILEDYEINGAGLEANIIVTQPRRIAAISVAERVAWERGESVGKSVGYSIRLENTLPRMQGSILYCTTGILLGRLQKHGGAAGISHIVIDEVHERDLEIDFLLVVVRELLKQHNALRVIIMSATVDSLIYTRYFSDCPAIHIPGLMHPVQVCYLEDLATYMGKSSLLTTRLQKVKISEDEDVDVNLVAHVLMWIVEDFGKDDGAVLCFLPGMDHIIMVKDRLQKSSCSKRMMVLPLHSQLPWEEQRAAFACAPLGIRKVVLATNIAESSVTIDDVVYVVDTGKVKEKCFDPSRNMSTLRVQWTSQASARQRQGRAGRVRAGFCFRLYTREIFTRMLDNRIPEMQRLPLEELCLQIKAITSLNVASEATLRTNVLSPCDEGKEIGIVMFLSKALQPPKAQAVHSAVKLLEELGAIDKKEKLTPLGSTLAKLAIPPRFGKMLVYGALLGSLDPLLTIAAAACVRDPFVAPINDRVEADRMRESFAVGSSYGSDHLAVVNAFEQWLTATSHGKGNSFCEASFLSPVTMKLIAGMRRQLRITLAEAGILEQWTRPTAQASIQVARSLLISGLYPNVANSEFNRESRGMKNATKHLYRWRIGFRVQNGRVLLHPTCVIKEKQLNPTSRYYLVFQEKVLTNQVFARGCSLLPPLAVILMGWNMRLTTSNAPLSDKNDEDDLMILEVEGWLKFLISRRCANLLLELRESFDRVMSRWVSGCAHKDTERDLMNVLVAILEASCNDMLATVSEQHKVR